MSYDTKTFSVISARSCIFHRKIMTKTKLIINGTNYFITSVRSPSNQFCIMHNVKVNDVLTFSLRPLKLLFILQYDLGFFKVKRAFYLLQFGFLSHSCRVQRFSAKQVAKLRYVISNTLAPVLSTVALQVTFGNMNSAIWAVGQ